MFIKGDQTVECYISDKVTWEEARRKCSGKSGSGSLLVLSGSGSNQQKQLTCAQHEDDYGYWLGLRNVTKQAYRSLDGKCKI